MSDEPNTHAPTVSKGRPECLSASRGGKQAKRESEDREGGGDPAQPEEVLEAKDKPEEYGGGGHPTERVDTGEEPSVAVASKHSCWDRLPTELRGRIVAMVPRSFALYIQDTEKAKFAVLVKLDVDGGDPIAVPHLDAQGAFSALFKDPAAMGGLIKGLVKRFGIQVETCHYRTSNGFSGGFSELLGVVAGSIRSLYVRQTSRIGDTPFLPCLREWKFTRLEAVHLNAALSGPFSLGEVLSPDNIPKLGHLFLAGNMGCFAFCDPVASIFRASSDVRFWIMYRNSNIKWCTGTAHPETGKFVTSNEKAPLEDAPRGAGTLVRLLPGAEGAQGLEVKFGCLFVPEALANKPEGSHSCPPSVGEASAALALPLRLFLWARQQ